MKYRGSLLGNDRNTKAATDLHWDGLGNSQGRLPGGHDAGERGVLKDEELVARKREMEKGEGRLM